MPDSTNVADVVSIVTTQRSDAISTPTTKATTPAGQPDVQLIAMPWWKIVGVRVLRVYLQGLLGFLVAGSTGMASAVGVPIGEFGNVFVTAASLAVAPAFVSLLQNSIELLTKLDVNFPQARG